MRLLQDCDDFEKSRICASLSKSQQRVNERKVGSENLASNGKAIYHNMGSHQQYVPERKNLIQDFDHIQKLSPKGAGEPLNRYSAKKAAILTVDSLQESENLSTVVFSSPSGLPSCQVCRQNPS